MKTDAMTASVDVRKLRRVVAVMTYVRAGSGLLSSLLDDHPNVLTTPDCVLLNFYEFWDLHSHLPAPKLVTAFIDYYAVLFDSRLEAECFGQKTHKFGEYLGFTRLGPGKNEHIAVDRDRFTGRMLEMIGAEPPVSRRLFFQAVHLAYSEAAGRTVTDPVISFGLHIAEPTWVDSIIEDFPDVLFLQMVRHPLKGLGSHFRHYHLGGRHSPRQAFQAIRATLYRGRVVPEDAHARWRAVRLEDLHAKPEETVRKIAEWVGLPWHPTLLQSTIGGKQWWNEDNSPQVAGFSTAITRQRYDDYFTAFDRFRLSVILAPKCLAWDYPVAPIHRALLTRLVVLPLLLWPFRMEVIAMRALGNVFREDDRSLYKRVRRVVFSGLVTLALTRRLVFGAWRELFGGPRRDVPLL